MAYPMRIEFPGAWYHVINRGAGRRKIFLSHQDRKAFLDLLGEVSQTFHLEVHAFSLIDNHYHLLIHTPQAGLSRAMRHLNGVYVLGFNRRHKTDGPLFRGRYKAKLVNSEEYLLELVRYIHLNPVMAHITQKAHQHRWTSHRLYLKEDPSISWLETGEVLSRFGQRLNKARRSLDEFVHAGVPKQVEKELTRNRLILGNHGFKEWVYRNFVDDKRDKEEIPKRDRKPKWVKSTKEVLEHVAYAYNLHVTDIRCPKAAKKRNDARSMAIYLSRKLTGIPQKELARWMNIENTFTIAKSQQRFKERIQKDKRLKQLTNQVERLALSNVKA